MARHPRIRGAGPRPPSRGAVPLLLSALVFLSCAAAFPGSARGEEEWKTELAAVCGQVDLSPSLSREALVALAARCDRLLPTVEALEEPLRKTYLFRLRKCRELFRYVSEAGSGNATEPPQ
jgi:hypothetical protein